MTPRSASGSIRPNPATKGTPVDDASACRVGALKEPSTTTPSPASFRSPSRGAATSLRELWEETGITIAHIKPLGRIKEWLYYDFAPGTAPRKGRNHKGQRQLWFAYRFTGPDSAVDLVSHGPQEFSEWKWAKLEKTPDKVVPFKRDVYARLASEFAPFAKGRS